LVPKNSILCTCIASIGKNCIVPINSCFNQQINSISVNNQYDYLFVYYALSQNVDKLISTASQGTILILPKSKFLNIEILVTKLNEQLKISNFLKQIDNLKSTINTQLNNLNQVKQYYLKNMFV
jgi:type I restriction enzyme S subunit